ncbi:uncharacterized protein RAG0_16264 [Rhynchosporium agropyri]|uniref:Cell wall anchored protein n=1 Tax=Rhynchosporium agropyri TaxID=914238 RepID=A0A1E1LPL4_9HELO|nr:uncharacterized protein RAG0_16264 [Rhynchosporium agropyri]
MKAMIGLLLLFVSLSLQQKDPSKDFCRRFGHQTAVIDRRLYIDGGLVNWNPISQNRNNYTNTWLVFQDLNSSPPGIEVPKLYSNLTKNASMPSVSGAALWQDDVNKKFYLFGGDYYNISPNTPNLLTYDTLLDDWQQVGPPNKPIQSVSYGGWVAISKLGQGFILGGWLSSNSVPGWPGTPLATNSLIKYNMDTNDWTNSTGPADSIPRAEGVMLYVPASDDGLLVYFGGLTAPLNNGTTLAAPMSLIHIYDIRSSKWYTQTAGGDVPSSRRKFCAGAVWAPDQSSYNIYLYGGMGFGANSSGFDDVYILTMPSFKWIKWWESSAGGKPHHSLSCNVVGGQMLIIGGTFPLGDDCDSPSVWGTHNLDLGKNSGKMWKGYSLNITSYVVPPEIISVVGGSSLGGATATAPSAGFDNGDLGVYFAQKASVAVRSPTRSLTHVTSAPPNPESPHLLSTGAIVGIAIGGLILLLALLLAGCCFIHRHRKKHADPGDPLPAEIATNPAPTYSHLPLRNPTTPYSDQGEHQQSYQLATNAPPVELSVNNYEMQMQKVNPDAITIHQMLDNNPPSPHHISPSLSPHPSYNNVQADDVSPHGYGGQVSPAPTYSSSLGKGGRKLVATNQTFYSP